MGFSGGGANILKPHKHNSLTLQDGGNLDFTGSETQSDMTAGSVTYSDGSHLQELGVGSPGNALKVSAGNIPEWSNTGLLTLTSQTSVQTGLFSTASATFVAVGNGLLLTLPVRAGGKALVCCNYTLSNTGANNNYVALFDDGVTNSVYQAHYGQYDTPSCICGIFDLDGSVIELYVRTLGGLVKIVQSPANVAGSITAFEIS